MMPFGSVPVASSHVLTSPTVASPSAILCRMASADDQNTADSGLPAASMPRLMPGSDSSAASGGTVSRASATSRLVSRLSGRPARSATRSASRFTPRSVRLFARSRPATVCSEQLAATERSEQLPAAERSEQLPAAEVGPQYGGHPDLRLARLQVLYQRGENARRGDRGVVQGVGEPHRPVRVLVADAGPPGLPVVQRRAAVRLAVRAQRWQPGVDVVHPVLAGAHVTGGALHHLVGQAEPLQQLLGGTEQLLVPVVGLGVIRRADDELFHLLELVDSQQPAHVAAGAAGFPPEARRDAAVPDREVLEVQDLVAVEADQGDLRRSRQVQVVGGDRVGFLAVRRELAGADQRFLPHQRRDADQREVLVPEQVQGVGVHGALEQHHVAGQRVGPLPGDLAGPGEVSPAALFQQLHVVQGLEIELRRGAISPDGHVRRLVGPDRRTRPRDGRGEQQQRVQLLVRLSELSTKTLDVIIQVSQVSSALLAGRYGPAGRAPPERLGIVHFVLEFATGLVELEQLVHVQVDALFPDSSLDIVRVLSDKSLVQHGYASVLVRISLLASPLRKRYQQYPARRPAVSGRPSWCPSWCRAVVGGRYGGYAATREGGGECC